ncbi:antitoxin Xre/MbcA/ParS toxin-binding domain-containing protein [Pseudomonas sp. HLMP]|uniref:antitoxin Xre/MbcA/ParS toxin-binding domain-containing protein n=1 Tax=Pseudomonas sp. HLMP TaxID=3153767 RepID=UPI00396719C0
MIETPNTHLSCVTGAAMKFEELIQRQAKQVFGSKAKADVWLARPRLEFGGSTALESVRDEAEYLRVKTLLDRIDHGYGS